MPVFDIPERFARTMTDLYGEEGAEWLRRLPELIAACERRWSLTAQAPFTLTYNYVAPAVRADGTEMVLKLGMPDGEARTQIVALRLYDGHGSVQLLDGDADAGMMLLERLRPGTPLTLVADDEEATRIAAGVMRALRRPVPPGHPFPTVAKWAAGLERLRRRYNGGTGPLAREMVERAEALFADLLGTMGEAVLLHGDLHQDNIVRAEREPWLALDPKGVAGEAEYEVGALLRNPLPWLLEQPDRSGCWHAEWTFWQRSWATSGSGSWAGAWRRRCSQRGGALRIMAPGGKGRWPARRCCRRCSNNAKAVGLDQRMLSPCTIPSLWHGAGA